jgi:hypothetical protein
LRNDSSAIERQVLSWNLQGQDTRGRPRNSWCRTIEEGAETVGKTWREVKVVAGNRVRWRCFVSGATGNN